MGSIVFKLYRYQILPISKQYDLRFSLEDVIANKNRLFAESLMKINPESSSTSKINYRITIEENTLSKFLLVISREKNVKYYRKDHVKDIIPSFPPAYILIDNANDIQIIAVQNTIEYSSTEQIIKVLIDRINAKIKYMNLYVKYSSIYRESSFWKFVENHKNEIAYVYFEIITPNMSSISKNLSDDFKRIAKATNAVSTKYKIQANMDSHLNIDRDNRDIAGLADYTSRGGGESKIKLRGTKIDFRSNDFQLQVEIPEIDIPRNYSNLLEKIVGEVYNGSDR
ncbi:MAG: hypothetical protein HDR50_04940 [Desulfovibrio sp.]|uniref:hypothetical protein n=1 Tax=Desulfovibrio sp. TaxID=885 RepID=UPI001A7CC99B|nr:hypothetical protein [Desulfovibrio sp.]MBD5417000.1 hypothetical protein [Desulfovibrio sp.]